MSENPNDPAGTTQQFRAFVTKGQQPAGAKSGLGTGAIVAITSVAVLLALVAVLLLVL